MDKVNEAIAERNCEKLRREIRADDDDEAEYENYCMMIERDWIEYHLTVIEAEKQHKISEKTKELVLATRRGDLERVRILADEIENLELGLVLDTGCIQMEPAGDQAVIN